MDFEIFHTDTGIIAAFMVPHPPLAVPAVGRGREKQIAETIAAYEKVAEEIAALRPDTIIITSPHSVMYADYFHISPGKAAKGSFAAFGAPQVKFKENYDEEFVQRLSEIADENGISAGTMGERDKTLDHGTMVPLWFIENQFKDFKLVRIGLSGLPFRDHYILGELISRTAEKLGRRAVLVASGDLSHKLKESGPYGYAPEGPEYDERIMNVCSRAAFGELFDFDENLCEKSAECGHRSFVIMAGAFDGIDVKATQLSHQDVTGVGYGICTFYPQGKDESRHFLEIYLDDRKDQAAKRDAAADEYVRLAHRSLESYILERKKIDIPSDVPEEMVNEKAGVFVSIHKEGRLRGCMGTILPATDCVAEEIIQNAVSASTRDPRFDPIEPDELPWLELNVDVLTAPEDIDSASELDVKRYGVIVTSGYKRGLLLPDLEGVDSVEEQVSIACRKAGIREGESIKLQRFEVIRHI